MANILFTEEAWRNSHLSIAKFYGRITYNGKSFIIVNKEGKDLFQCTHEANKAGRTMAIEPGEPADLIREDFLPLYRELGRDGFIEILRKHNINEPEDMKKFTPKNDGD